MTWGYQGARTSESNSVHSVHTAGTRDSNDDYVINVQKRMFEYLNSSSSLEFVFSLGCRTDQVVVDEEVCTARL